MVKKTASQVKRLIARAESRGETYIPQVENDTVDDEAKDPSTRKTAEPVTPGKSTKKLAAENTVKLKAAISLTKEISKIDASCDLKAKERRSAKRKSEAIAIESSGFPTAEALLEWYKNEGKQLHQQEEEITTSMNKLSEGTATVKKRANPYIIFVGQLAFDTTKEQLFQHLQKQLEGEFKVTEESVQIRLLQDAKTNKSRGMAFVEVKEDPELLYALLKLHHTFLGGRRINVERSAGGGADTRKAKIKQFREEQLNHMDETVNAMLEEYYKRGEIQDSGEIDEGVIKLCKRHSATVVQAALERYVESNGRDMDNPSAYLTFLLGKLAEEGIYNDREKEAKEKSNATKKSEGKEQRKSSRITREKSTVSKDTRGQPSKPPKFHKVSSSSSEFSKQGVDMSVSDRSGDLHQIFPSLRHGRGRGRGYM